MKRTAIAIQARTNNTRLPGKCQMDINGKTMLEWVILACQRAKNYLNKGQRGIDCDVFLLVPENDQLALIYQDRRDLNLITGSEQDVLSRYKKVIDQSDYDFVVRITSDCPLIKPFIISKHIILASQYDYDYLSNVHPNIRMHPDGWDCEVISRRMLEFTDAQAISDFDREHVTTLIRKKRPRWAKIGHVVGNGEFSHLKISVDTLEDLEFVRTYQKLCSDKINMAKDKSFGDGYHIL